MKKNRVLSKTQFIKIINALMLQHEHDKKCSEAFRIILPNDYISNYNNDIIINEIIIQLKELMGDVDNCWIDYYIYDLDFGKKNDRLKVFSKLQKEIPLKTPEDLYNLLLTN